MNPQLFSSRPLNPRSGEDFEKLWQHYAWAQGLGVKWFNLCLDDVEIMSGLKIDATDHCKLVNKLFARLRENDRDAQFIFCATWYGGSGNEPDHVGYLDTVARDLNPEIHLFWTGDTFTRITRAAAESYKKRVKHRLFLWDNYPVNDGQQTVHLGPVTGRDTDLCDVIDGYISNPMASQNEMNRIPLATCADYAYNPKGYDPTRSIGQAILHAADTDARRALLLDLVEQYPGFIVYPGGTGTNPPRIEFQKLVAAGNFYLARNVFRHLEDIAARLDREFPDRYPATKKHSACRYRVDEEHIEEELNEGTRIGGIYGRHIGDSRRFAAADEAVSRLAGIWRGRGRWAVLRLSIRQDGAEVATGRMPELRGNLFPPRRLARTAVAAGHSGRHRRRRSGV